MIGIHRYFVAALRDWLLGREDFHSPPVSARKARPPVLMLDFDGVLHPAQSGSLERLPLLERWLEANPEVHVVVSSDWRCSHTVTQFAEYFSEALRARVLDVTPEQRGVPREAEILAWLQAHDFRPWVALDDKPGEFPTTAHRHLAATDYFDALTPGVLEQLSEKLKAQTASTKQ